MIRLRTVFAFALVLAVAAFATAQQPFSQTLKQMNIEQKLGAQAPGDAVFRDETGAEIKFSSLFGQRPLILLPMFFNCKGICGTEVDSVLKNVAKMKGTPGKDYDVVLLSIHPKETPELARDKKVSLMKVFNEQDAASGFHFLTGDLENIRKVTDAVGFGFAYDPTEDRINHPAGLMILTPSGKVAQYMFGSEYAIPVMENALTLAAQEKLGEKADEDKLGCIMIDKKTEQRSAAIENTIRLIAAGFALCIFTWIGAMAFKYRREPLGPNSHPNDGGSSTRA